MVDGYVKVAAITPKVVVADVDANVEEIITYMEMVDDQEIKVAVFPELCITGYTCGDLFEQELLLNKAVKGLKKLVVASKQYDGLYFVGLPMEVCGRLYNVAAAISGGKLLGVVPKSYLPNYREFYEARYFAPADKESIMIRTGAIDVPFGTKLLFSPTNMPEVKIGVEICEDLWMPDPPSVQHALAGANLIVNLSASDEVTGKANYRKELVVGQSGRLICGYIYASAGDGESTSDLVYAGHNIICENGQLLKESQRFTTGLVSSEIDIFKITGERRAVGTYYQARLVTNQPNGTYEIIPFTINKSKTILTRHIEQQPFVPSDIAIRDARCSEILAIQSNGLKKRLEHTHAKKAIVGISGGLDSTLALLVTVKAFDLLQLDHEGIIAVTMPGFGTTDRTYDNAIGMIKEVGATLREISIVDAVNTHFKDIGHDPQIHDVTYENCQARERTQILMDLANQEGGLVIGTGDMSELALGWATYNGDHMSMYGVNASVPKTLVRYLVDYYAGTCENDELEKVLLDVLETPVSPELLPPKDGLISQKTEELVGPYELHDFFLYHVLRYGFEPKKIYRLAKLAFVDCYDKEVIKNWLQVFYKRFFSQQFKRSCLPDGPKVGTVAISPRGDLRMPSDASASIWLKQVQSLE